MGLVLQDNVQEDDPNTTAQHIKQMWRMLTAHHISSRKVSTPAAALPTAASSLPPDFGLYMPNTASGSYGSSPAANMGTSLGNSSDYFSKQYHKRHRQLSEDPNLSATASPPSDISFTSQKQQQTTTRRKNRNLTTRRKKKHGGFEGKFHQDVVGVTFLEICHARDLPPERNCKLPCVT
jgi:hypothetical protein